MASVNASEKRTGFDPELIVTNMKKRFSGVSGTINSLLPVQAQRYSMAFVGAHMPGVDAARAIGGERFQHLSAWRAIWVSRRRAAGGKPRIWHVRRDPEMMLAIFLRDVLCFPIRIVFTSAAKHRHSWFPRWLISRMDGVIATTPEAASFVPNTTRVVFHGANLERFSPPAQGKAAAWAATGLPGKYGVGVFGRIRPSKGSDIYVDAMIRLLPNYPDFTAVLTGLCTDEFKAYKAEMDAKIAAAGLQHRIIFLGELPIEAVPSWYQNVSIMVACPRYEPFGITPLEAMASGCAVVASRTGAFEYLVAEGETGHVVEAGSVDALVRGLEPLLQDPSRAEQLGRAGLSRVGANFSIQHEADGIDAVYEAVCLVPGAGAGVVLGAGPSNRQ